MHLTLKAQGVKLWLQNWQWLHRKANQPSGETPPLTLQSLSCPSVSQLAPLLFLPRFCLPWKSCILPLAAEDWDLPPPLPWFINLTGTGVPGSHQIQLWQLPALPWSPQAGLEVWITVSGLQFTPPCTSLSTFSCGIPQLLLRQTALLQDPIASRTLQYFTNPEELTTADPPRLISSF